MAERQEEVWVVDEDDRFRSLLPAGFHFSTFSLPRGAGRAQQALQRAGLGSLFERTVVAKMQRIADEFRPDIVHVHNIAMLGVACAWAGAVSACATTVSAGAAGASTTTGAAGAAAGADVVAAAAGVAELEEA